MDSPQTRGSQGWLRLTSFVVAQHGPARLPVSLEADLLDGHRPPKDVRLLARRDGRITTHRPVSSDLERIAGYRLNRRSQVLRWRICFELPLAGTTDQRARFQLVSETGLALELPPLGWQTDESRPVYERRTSRLGALLAGSAALLAGLGPGLALADGGPDPASPTSGAAITHTVSTGTATTPTSTSQSPTTTTTTAGQPPTTTTVSQPPTTTSQSPPPTTTQTTTTQTTTTQTTATTTTTTTPAKPGRTGSSGGSHKPRKRPTHHHAGAPSAKHRSHPDHHPAKRHPAHPAGGSSRRSGHRAHPAPAPAPSGTSVTPLPGSETSFSAPVLTDLLSPAQLRTYNVLVGGMVEPPPFLQRIYRAAGKRYGIPWQVLAAINYVETRYGKDLAVSSAGALGWMQFMPSTWAEYGVSVNLKGKPAAGLPNPWDPTDAIFAAARYLHAAGAGPNLPGAVYAYNHAGWYVQEVLSIAEEINRHNMWPQRHAARKVAAMLTMARILNGLPYVWGGGHSNFTMVQAGYDCSGFVSAVLHAGGYLQGPVTTQTLPGQPLILPGRGRYVTIRDRTYLSADQDHVIIDIGGQWWESGGWGVESDRVHRMHDVTRAYLDSFNLILHPRGL